MILVIALRMLGLYSKYLFSHFIFHSLYCIFCLPPLSPIFNRLHLHLSSPIRFNIPFCLSSSLITLHYSLAPLHLQYPLPYRCWSSLCPDQTQADSAAAFYSAICLGSSPGGGSAMPTSVSDISSSAAAAAAPTGTDTLATATASATGTGAIGGVTTAPASGTGSGSSAGMGGSAAPAATSKAWGERSLVLPAGGAMAAVLGLAILL